MMTPADLAILEQRFSERYANEWGRLYTCNDSNIIICELLQPYTPINEFMDILRQKAHLIEMYGCDKFIFDKREIRGFHQPSMEWYYLTWKVEMYRKYGLSKHRKLFTTEEWFLRCIEAGRAEIRRKDPGSIVHTLDIKISKSLQDAIDY